MFSDKQQTLVIPFISSFFLILVIHGLLGGYVDQSLAQPFPTQRNVYQWPFSSGSIWNMPIGTNAEYTPQPIDPEHINGLMTDLSVIVLTPDAEPMNLYGTEYRWQPGTTPETRCQRRNDIVHLQLPIPDSYVTSFFAQLKPNHPGVILQSDGRTLVQTSPFQVCPGEYATTGLRKPNGVTIDRILRREDVDIYSDGMYGSQGGSGLSALGGAIRVGELSPGSAPIRHALKISFPGEHYLYYDDATDIAYRWPARTQDRGAKERYGGSEPEAQIGCLRAIPPWVDLDTLGLETEPGRKIAWTLQNYGAYQVEEVPWARMMIGAEEGPAGNVATAFKEDWGYDLVTKDKAENPFFRDMIRLMPHIHIVSNNAPDSIGGGGTPRQPLAPELDELERLA